MKEGGPRVHRKPPPPTNSCNGAEKRSELNREKAPRLSGLQSRPYTYKFGVHLCTQPN